MCTKYANLENEYAKNVHLKEEDVKILKEWMNKQQHLPKISDLQIILFLHSCYYSIEKAKICIEKYYTIRYHVPEVFKNRNPILLHDQLRLGLTTALHTDQSQNIVYTKFIRQYLGELSLTVGIKCMDMANSLHYQQHGTSEKHIAILDAKDMTLSQVLKMNVVIIKKMLIYLQEAVPIRLQEVHVINTSPLVHKLFNLIKPFIAPELVKLIYFHDTMDTLFAYVPQTYLPREYDGSAGSIEELSDKVLQNLEENAKFFEEEELLVTDERKRLDKSEYSAESIFGMDGTFKKLDID